MAHHYIPFVHGRTDWPLVRSTFAHAAGCRITVQTILTDGRQQTDIPKLWVDCGIDGLHSAKIDDPEASGNQGYNGYISQFANFNRIADPQFQRRPDKSRVAAFVKAVLDRALDVAPNCAWLSVPQLPYVMSAERNKINRALAEATAEWKAREKFRGKLILPVVLVKARQTDKKTDRNPTVALALSCFEASSANGIWVVDSTLDDQDGVQDFENIRFPGLIRFQEELKSDLPPGTVAVAGPYWGLNLVLWARNLINLPAIGIGRSYRYYLAGGIQKEGNVRVAIPPLRRLAVWSPELRLWLESVLKKLPKSDPAHEDFALLLKNFELLQAKDYARRQIASFYKQWLEKLEDVQLPSRALTLYQDLSAAYVLGSALPALPSQEKVKSPARIAKQLMVNCL